MKRTLIWSIAILILILLRLYFTSNHQFVGTYQNVTFANQKIVINSDGTYFLSEQFNHLKSANKCFAFSLSLSGTASALGTLAVMPVTQAIQVASP
jgi:hypothetical protein